MSNKNGDHVIRIFERQFELIEEAIERYKDEVTWHGAFTEAPVAHTLLGDSNGGVVWAIAFEIDGGFTFQIRDCISQFGTALPQGDILAWLHGLSFMKHRSD